MQVLVLVQVLVQVLVLVLVQVLVQVQVLVLVLSRRAAMGCPSHCCPHRLTTSVRTEVRLLQRYVSGVGLACSSRSSYCVKVRRAHLVRRATLSYPGEIVWGATRGETDEVVTNRRKPRAELARRDAMQLDASSDRFE
ncbi:MULTISPECIES: hypothetical protein [unclassified Rhizobacter]|uniref:hypothetical protein n=1 Tax=unclassified Rhizobacter TaxID=2640088 RepID=UPI0012FBD392|nr:MULTISPECIES: hypothetical protein [unclassified Rhizobacter]